MASARDGVASLDGLRHEAEALSRRLTSAADLSPQTATHVSGRLSVTVDGAGRPTEVTLAADWRDDIEPEDLAGAVQATAAMAEQLRLDAWTAQIAPDPSMSAGDGFPAGAAR